MVVCWRLGCRASILGMKVVYIAGDDIDSIGPELLFLNVNCKIGRLCGGQWKMPRPTIGKITSEKDEIVYYIGHNLRLTK